MDAAEFEQLVRAELKLRDQRRAARAFHPVTAIEADEACVSAILAGAGFGGVADHGKALKVARRSRQRDEDRAFARKAG